MSCALLFSDFYQISNFMGMLSEILDLLHGTKRQTHRHGKTFKRHKKSVRNDANKC
jgi:hypothetical protein